MIIRNIVILEAIARASRCYQPESWEGADKRRRKICPHSEESLMPSALPFQESPAAEKAR